jgi:L-2-hydroxyglutarate oxidase
VTRSSASIAVIGGGIVGLASAYQTLLRYPSASVRVLEKEADVGLHQSTRNSGVMHAGLHYAPGSLKARLAREGLRRMVDFCVQHGVAHEQCGKVVVATSEAEVERLRALQERGTRNGLMGLRWLAAAELREIEPHAAGIAALHVPEEGIADYRGVCDALRREIVQRGGEVLTGAAVRALRRTSHGWDVDTPGKGHVARTIINCAGLYSDRVAQMSGEDIVTRVVPFRGEYWMLRPERAHLVRNLIYPVPDPAFPFLGVHLTRIVSGGVEAGPNAVLALAREGYRWSSVNIRDSVDALSYPGLWRFLWKYPKVAAYEVARSFSGALFLRSLQTLVPELSRGDLVRGSAGVRAQVMTRSGQLVQDFEIVSRSDAIHVINAPSPAATASLAIGEYVAGLLPN